MLRIWKGPEMEGNNLGETTLFVCSDSKIKLADLQQVIESNSDVSKIYLGGGRTPFYGFTDAKDNNEFRRYCETYNLKLAIETEFQDLDNVIDFLDYAEIILSIRTTRLKISDVKNIKLKLDDYLIARVYDNSIYYDTDLQTVKENKYSCDVVIYEEE